MDIKLSLVYNAALLTEWTAHAQYVGINGTGSSANNSTIPLFHVPVNLDTRIQKFCNFYKFRNHY